MKKTPWGRYVRRIAVMLTPFWLVQFLVIFFLAQGIHWGLWLILVPAVNVLLVILGIEVERHMIRLEEQTERLKKNLSNVYGAPDSRP